MGLQYTTATNGVILNSAVPVMIIVLGWLIYRDTITRMQGLGVADLAPGRARDPHARRPVGDREPVAQQGRPHPHRGRDVLGRVHDLPAHEARRTSRASRCVASCAVVGAVLLLPLFAYEMLLLGGRIEWSVGHRGRHALRGRLPVVRCATSSGIVRSREVGSNVAGIFMHLMPVFGSAARLDLPRRTHPGLPSRGNRAHPGRHHAHHARPARASPSPAPRVSDMDLILWRHAEAEDPGGKPDMERELTQHGRKQAERMAAVARSRACADDWRILVSPVEAHAADGRAARARSSRSTSAWPPT